VAGGYLSLLNTFQYGFYLACSWLWCLGGFFPLILGRDYGWPALAAFTIFNVGGAIAMGFYFQNRVKQKAFEQKHKPAVSLFSYITIAYQIFLVVWLGLVIDQPLLIVAVLAIAYGLYLSKGLITYWALLFYLLSIGLFVSFMGNDLPPIDISAKGYWPHALLPLAIGFIFSPYLDITFHRAYRDSDHPKRSFMLGFGVLFLSLLAFVFYYANSLGDIFFEGAIPADIIYPVIGFLVLQIAFTISAHCAELCTQQYLKPSILAVCIGLISLVSLLLLMLIDGKSIPFINSSIEETIYKSFLFFYSLVFPLYLLLGKSRPTFIWVLAICTPAYSLGFLVGEEYSFGLTIGVVIMSLVTFCKLRTGR
jgi:hypothetical protein